MAEAAVSLAAHLQSIAPVLRRALASGAVAACVAATAPAWADGASAGGASRAPDYRKVIATSQAAIGRPLVDVRLRDSTGKDVRFSDYRGRPLLISLVYTGCFQACPVATQFLAEAVRDMLAWCGEGSWEATWDQVMAKYGHYHPVHTINNACLVLMGLLHSGGDFTQAICIAVTGGLDTDCNGATAGSVISGIASAIMPPIIFSKPIASSETALAIDENAGLASFHRNGTGYSANANRSLRTIRSVIATSAHNIQLDVLAYDCSMLQACQAGH